MNLTSHFTLAEFTASATATRLKIKNEPGPRELGNLKRVAKDAELIRIAIGEAMHITSGIRVKRLNAELGGSDTSQHIDGEAMDFVVKDLRRAMRKIVWLYKQGYIKPNQVILEITDRKQWIHYAVKKLYLPARMDFLFYDGKSYRKLKKEDYT